MHMQDGIGRGGYRVLAFVFLGVGGLGLLVATVVLAPADFVGWLGLGLAAIAVATLAGLTLSALGPVPFVPNHVDRGSMPAGGGVVPLPTPEPPADADPAADLGFDYPDSEPLAPDQPGLGSLYQAPPPAPSRPAAPLPTPRAMGRPAQRSAPPSGKANPNDWPERRGPSGITRRQAAEQAKAPRTPAASPGPMIEMDGPRPPRREPPVVMARTVASAEATGVPEDMGVGKCGNCGVLLLAPKARPIRLQCPRCERVHTLA
jgi:hypothetical protein